MKVRQILVVLLVALWITVFWSAASAQDERDCKADCNEQQQQCVDSCGEHSNPIECEQGCSEDAYNCTQQCE